MEEMREMVAALRHLNLKGASQVIDRLREMQKKATKQVELATGCSPRDGNYGTRI